MIDTGSSTRIVGLKPLATLILASKIKPIQFKLFEIQREEEIDKTRETPRKRKLLKPVEMRRAEKTLAERRRVKEEPAILKFSEKLKEFIDKVRKDINEIAPFYGCKAVDLRIELSKGVINIRLRVSRKNIFSKCKVDKLREVLEGDVDLYLSMLDLNIPFALDIKEV